MEKPAVLMLVAGFVVACGPDMTYRTGFECNQMNTMHCGQDANGSSVALLCQGTPGQWTQVGACPACDHITNDQTSCVCGGVNVAVANNPCQTQDAAACDIGNITHIVKCQFGKWTLSQDCSMANQICGYTAPNMLGCTLPKT